MTCPFGVSHRAMVIRTAEPSISSCSTCTVPLPKGRLTNQDRSVVVGERTGNNLGAAGAALVHEHDQRHV